MSTPTVSVTMPVRNMEHFLGEAIESLLAQTFTDFEFIIVDFGSTDRSKEIVCSCATKDSRIKFHELPDLRLVDARNAAIALSKGRYIAVMDADDVSLPNRLQLEVEFLERNPHVALVGGAAEWIDAKGGASLGIHEVPCSDQEIKEALLTHCSFWHATVVARRSAIEAVGGYRAAFVYSHDFDLEIRVSERYSCANLREALIRYRIHPDQLSLRKRNQQTVCQLAAIASACQRVRGNPDPLDAVVEISPSLLSGLGVTEATQQSALLADCRNWVVNMIKAGERSAALEGAIEVLRWSDWRYAERRRAADVWFLVAYLFWGRKEYLNSLLAVGRAVVVRPVAIGHPLKILMRRMGLA